MTSPIIPWKMRAFAFFTLSSFPPEVIHLKPPIRMINTAMIPRNPIATRIMEEIASTRFPELRPAAPAKSEPSPCSVPPKSSSAVRAPVAA